MGHKRIKYDDPNYLFILSLRKDFGEWRCCNETRLKTQLNVTNL